MSLMPIRSFSYFLLTFGLIFAICLTIVLFYCLKGVLKRPPLLKQFLVNKCVHFCGYEAFFLLRNMMKNGENYFSQICRFFLFFRQVSEPIMTCILFYEHMDTQLAEKRFPLDICAFVISKKLLTFFQFFSQSCVRKPIFS